MDWIRLGASGKDLTGLGSRAGHLFVTKQELVKHNKIDDIWLSIRGRVYNVTSYVPFHPGGAEELMKAAGIDATSLFDQVHPWVNYEQILQKCIVGKLVAVDPQVNTEKLFFGASPNSKNTNKENVESNAIKIPDSDKPEAIFQDGNEGKEILLPRFDWIQKLEYITAIFYTGPFSNPLVEVYPPDEQQAIIVCITSDKKIYKNELIFNDNIEWPCSVKITWETGKIELGFKKTQIQVWESYGKLTQSSMDASNNNLKFSFVLKHKSQINHNIFLLGFERCDECKMVVPIGRHVRLFIEVNGQELSRSYTPIPSILFTPTDSSPDQICLMIKKYETGAVSSSITAKELDDVIKLSKPLGNFDLKRIEKKETFLFLAAGTGITPMMSLLIFLLERRIKKCQFARLLFFNKTLEDIPFKNEFNSMEEGDSRLKVDHVLSEPDSNWTGLTGHISKEMISNSIQEHIKDTGYTINDIFVFVCGPNQFLSLTLKELQSLDILDDQIHVFSG